MERWSLNAHSTGPSGDPPHIAKETWRQKKARGMDRSSDGPSRFEKVEYRPIIASYMPHPLIGDQGTLVGMKTEIGVGPKLIPKPSILDDCDYLGAFSGEKRWRRKDRKRIYTWDELHGEVEVFDKRGHHLGAIDPVSGHLTKDPVKGRKINV